MAVVALPLLVILSSASAVWQAATAADSGPLAAQGGDALTSLIGSGQPLIAGRFTVSQGFGCTAVATEPSPPAGEFCPPDSAHGQAIHFHTGIDLAAAEREAVFAVASGVAHLHEDPHGFGRHVVVDGASLGGAPLRFLYAHLLAYSVADGQKVSAGQLIGLVGSTGNSTGPHLHFEVQLRDHPVNPCAVFAANYLQPVSVQRVDCLAWRL